MKPVDIRRTIGVERFATWNEVMCAISFSAEGTIALVRESDDLRKEDSDLSGCACNLSEDDLWLAIACEMPDSKCN